MVSTDRAQAEAEDRDPAPSAGRSLAKLEAELQARASTDLARSDSPELIFRRAAVLRDNAMGIISEGDGSTDADRVGRLLALIPALLTVVDEARDTISRLRDVAGEPDEPKAISPYDASGKGRPGKPRWDSRGETA